MNARTGPMPEPPGTVHLTGAVGGQGTTTVATVLATLAARHRPTTLVAVRPRDVCAIAGTGPDTGVHDARFELTPGLTLQPPTRLDRDHPGDPGSVTVVDGGRADQALPHRGDPPGTRRWLVVRGPCYLALRASLEAASTADGVILLLEPGRALRAADVADVLGLPVVAEVPVDPRVARAVDAGVLLAQVARLPALRSLVTLAGEHWPPQLEASA